MNDEILIRHLLGETSEKENKSISAWINANPEHKKQYNHIRHIWETSKSLPYKSNIDPDSAWIRFQEKRSYNSDTKNNKYKSLRTILFPLQKMAAGFLLISLIAFISYWFWFRDSGYLFVVHLHSESVAKTERLADGSTVTLNKNTEIEFSRPIFENLRSVQMHSGEAFFKVVHDPTNPFIVNTKELTITVLGTSFNVRKNDSITEIIVETGIVRVDAGSGPNRLERGEKLTLDTRSEELEIVESQDQLYNYYIDNTFELKDTPLWRVAEVLESAFGKEIEVHPEISDLPLTTTLRADDLDNILRVIQTTFKIKITEKDNKIVMY
ncbi:FecR family protein [Membranihabitans maritimus]|uniref:FecR family protein n=1 Tax=Membranihabitans maritimus TaxID=2904244 RepID=UPI001F3D1ADC|nr:FecR domain-containing protein [Membranihabitans maritimus]